LEIIVILVICFFISQSYSSAGGDTPFLRGTGKTLKVDIEVIDYIFSMGWEDWDPLVQGLVAPIGWVKEINTIVQFDDDVEQHWAGIVTFKPINRQIIKSTSILTKFDGMMHGKSKAIHVNLAIAYYQDTDPFAGNFRNVLRGLQEHYSGGLIVTPEDVDRFISKKHEEQGLKVFVLNFEREYTSGKK